MPEKNQLKERTALVNNIFAHRHNSRIVTASNIYTWKILDAGYKLSEAMYDYELHEKIHEEFIERFHFDVYNDSGMRNMFRVASALTGGGTLHHQIDDEAGSLIVKDHELMRRDEYEECTEDVFRFFWSKSLKRSVPDLTLGKLEQAVNEYKKMGAFGAVRRANVIEKHQALFLAPNSIRMPLDDLLVALRGIKGLSLDLRKCGSQVKDWADMSFSELKLPVIRAALDADLPDGYAAPLSLVFMAHSILNMKQFEELYWPYIKRTVDMAIERGKKIALFCESSMLRFQEFFREFPKGSVMLTVEQDDLAKVRKQVPNLALLGGLNANLLGRGTAEECVNQARSLVETLGDGFILSQNIMVSYQNDARRENLLAVQEFARDYRC